MAHSVHLFDGHHPDPKAILCDLIPTNDEDGPRGHDARNLLEVAIGRPLEQDNRPPASFALGGLENQLGVPLELGVQLQVARRVRGILVLAGFGVITHPGQVVLHHLIFTNCVLALSDLPSFTCMGFFRCIDFTSAGSRSTSPQYSRAPEG